MKTITLPLMMYQQMRNLTDRQIWDLIKSGQLPGGLDENDEMIVTVTVPDEEDYWTP